MANKKACVQVVIDGEIWLPCPEYEDIYLISNYGRLKRIQGGERRQVGRILRAHKSNVGYVIYPLSREGKTIYALAHRLVMRAFVGDCPPEITVNHLNGNKTDNRLENLEYATQGENNLHAVRVLGHRQGEKHYKAVLTDNQVREIKTLLREGVSTYQIAKLYGVSASAIRAIKSGRSWKHINISEATDGTATPTAALYDVVAEAERLIEAVQVEEPTNEPQPEPTNFVQLALF